MKRCEARGVGLFDGERLAEVLLGCLLAFCKVVCFELPADPIRNIKKDDFLPTESSIRSARTIRVMRMAVETN
jgi:hypothetical protein